MLLIYLLIAAAIPLLFMGGSAVANCIRLCRDFRARPGRRISDHPADGRRLFGIAVLGRLMGMILTADGVAEAGADAGRLSARRDRQLHSGFVVLVGVALAGALAIPALPGTTRCLADRID